MRNSLSGSAEIAGPASAAVNEDDATIRKSRLFTAAHPKLVRPRVAPVSVLALPGHEPRFEEAHGESECEGASRNDSDADKDNVRRQELRRGHDEIADASGRGDKLSGDERPPADAERNTDSGENFGQRRGKHDLAQKLKPRCA